MSIVEKKFYDKLKNIATNVGMKPEDILMVMTMESGLNPEAYNKHGGASGLVQIMPQTLKNIGFEGSEKDFTQLKASQQLDYIEKLIKSYTKYNDGPLQSAAHYHLANFLPAALKLPGIKRNDPNTILLAKNPDKPHIPTVSIETEKKYYESNKYIDTNNDGVITFGDLQRNINSKKNDPRYLQAVSFLNDTDSLPSVDNQEELLNNIDRILNKFLKANNNEYAIIKINSNNVNNSIEFARILCLALEEEFGSLAGIFKQSNNIEVGFKINKNYYNAVSQLTNALIDLFKKSASKANITNLDTALIKNIKSLYTPLSYKQGEVEHRKFLLKFI